MKSAFLVFPHQLFEENFKQNKNTEFILIEEPLLFSQYSFHKKKIILHRASMKAYAFQLEKKGFQTHYLDCLQLKDGYDHLKTILKAINPDEVLYKEVTDDWLNQKIKKELAGNYKLKEQTTPMFLSDEAFLQEQFSNKKHFSMAHFYQAQRKRMSILVHGNKPEGGKWSFDEENRKKLPKNLIPPPIYSPKTNEFVKEATAYIRQHFPNHIGSAENFTYAVDHSQAKKCLDDFIQNRFHLFGPYEDAISTQYTHLYHSVLTPYLNTGLLTPETVINKVLDFYLEENIPINSVEGFIRQIIGWREFMRAVYQFKGRRERTYNFWEHKRKLSYSFWEGTTGITPIDHTIQRLLEHAYTHHIERLMVMGNFMMLCEIDPDDIYKWFMEMYIDSYDWVMVPNVYSMSQYAGGGTSTTKPYISGSNYILKMSDYKKGEWSEIWDGLYWRFISKNKEFFQKNPRLSQMTLHLNKMSDEQLNLHIKNAEKILNSLF